MRNQKKKTWKPIIITRVSGPKIKSHVLNKVPEAPAVHIDDVYITGILRYPLQFRGLKFIWLEPKRKVLFQIFEFLTRHESQNSQGRSQCVPCYALLQPLVPLSPTHLCCQPVQVGFVVLFCVHFGNEWFHPPLHTRLVFVIDDFFISLFLGCALCFKCALWQLSTLILSSLHLDLNTRNTDTV